jgi:NAD(P)H-flavin reductase
MNIYEPFRAEILKIDALNHDTRVFRLRVPRGFEYEPGQFVELSIPGVGEAPISITSSPKEKGYIDLCVRKVGSVTNALHALDSNGAVFIRGPYGRGFPFEGVHGKDLVFLSGGIGLAPMRSAINHALAHKHLFGRIAILHGARTPADLLFKDEYDGWKKEARFLVTVDSPRNPDGNECGWNECVGVVTTLVDKLEYPIKDAVGFICGPPGMYRFAIQKFKTAGMEDRHIYVSLERLMKCGLGKCQHCQIDHKYACLDGPIFNLAEMRELPEAI